MDIDTHTAYLKSISTKDRLEKCKMELAYFRNLVAKLEETIKFLEDKELQAINKLEAVTAVDLKTKTISVTLVDEEVEKLKQKGWKVQWVIKL